MMNTDHVDWENTAKETCVEIIKDLREELRSLRLQYQERGYAMKETGDMVRSLYIPKIERLKEAIEAICRTVEKDYPFIRDIQRDALEHI